MNYRDPSGRVTLTEVLVAVDIAMTLQSIYLGSMALYHGEYKEAAIEFTSVAFWGLAGSRKVFRFGSWWNKCREVRVIYNNALHSIENTVSTMENAGKTAKEIAEAVVEIRNQSKIATRALMDAEDVAKLEARNMEKYGDPIGPSLEKLLLEHNGLYEEVIESSMKSNFWYNLLFLSF